MTVSRDDSDWIREVPGWSDYFVTAWGQVWSLKRRGNLHRLKSHAGADGYRHVTLCRKNSRPKTLKIYRLVLEAFVGPCPIGMHARHLDGNPANNAVENLCWSTPKENHADKIIHGTTVRGERNGQAKLTSDQVSDIRELLSWGIERKKIAKLFDVSWSAIDRIFHDKAWRK